MRGAKPATEHRVKELGRRSSWISLLLIVAFVALIGTTGYFAFRYVDRSTFNDARAFRVLDELVSQFENFQETMASLLALVPESADHAEYAQRWVLPGLKLDTVERSPCSSGAQQRVRFVLHMRDPGHSFSISRCVEISSTKGDAASGALSYQNLRVSGAMGRLLPAFVSQEFFDVALIGSRKGELLVDITKRSDMLGAVQLQQTRSAGVLIADIDGLLRRGALEIARSQAKGPKNADSVQVAAAPSHPVVFGDQIAGETYRVYAMAFRPTIAIELATLPGGRASAERFDAEPLYMIGLKRQSWAAQLSAGLGPSGSLAITFIVLLVFVLWPLMSLRFAGPQDPIPRMQVIALSTAALLLPAILAVAAVWAWNNLHLRIWADSGAEVYAQQIEDVLRADLSESAGLLTTYASAFYAPRAAKEHDQTSDSAQDTYKSLPGFPDSLIRHPRSDITGAEREPADCYHTRTAQIAEPVLLRTARREPKCPLGNWSPLHTVSPLDTEGRTLGLGPERKALEPRLTAFGKVPYRRSLSLPDREYFRAIRDHEEWRPDGVWQHTPAPKHGFVAQRLFNRGDAARVLQIAVPIEYDERRLGVVTADTRAYAISSALRVPLLRFAIVNASNGAVLFHSNDERSLAENFLLETEHDPILQRALVKRASAFTLNRVGREDHFTGEYMGTAHRFYYRPVAGVPWGIAVFYPLAEIAVVAQQAAIAALAGYMAIIIAIVALLMVIFASMPNRGDLVLLSLIWPRWEARGAYRALAFCGAVIITALVAMLLWHLNTQKGPGVLWWIVVVAACGALCLWLWKAANKKEMALRTYQAWYLACMVLVLLLTSALPAAWMATSYQDVALRAYLRDQLAQAATDLEHRELTIGRDLRRWVPVDEERARDYPNAQVLSRILSAPGYRNAWVEGKDQACAVWTVTTFDQQPWMSERGPPKLGIFGRAVWAMSIDSNLQRAGRTALPAGSGGAAGAKGCGADATSIPYWRRSTNGTTSQFLVPVAAQQQAQLHRERDIDAHYKYSVAVTAVGQLMILVLLLLLVSWIMARRLFGIRIPFASRFVDRESGDSMPVEPLLNVELHIAELERKHGSSFTTKDADDIRMTRCEAIYSEIWQKRSQDERLLLHQLAEGKFANPENQAVIEKLLYLGFLKLDPWPKIADRGLAAYARHAEKGSLFDKWQRTASASTWNSIRTPLLLVVVVIVGVLMWVAGSTMQILSATLAGMATLFGYVTQVTNLFKKGDEPPRSG